MDQATPVEVAPQQPEAPKPSPADAVQKPSAAQDLRDIQMLLVSGIFPGNVAPQVVKGYQILEKMAQKVEAEAK